MNFGKHEHITRIENGRSVCISCRQVVWAPIFESDDDRLDESGLMRRTTSWQESTTAPPLPLVLISLYFNAAFFGMRTAPISWYIDTVARLEDGRRKGVIDDQIWDILRELWESKCSKMKSP